VVKGLTTPARSFDGSEKALHKTLSHILQAWRADTHSFLGTFYGLTNKTCDAIVVTIKETLVKIYQLYSKTANHKKTRPSRFLHARAKVGDLTLFSHF
jgi:hypothetical protein